MEGVVNRCGLTRSGTFSSSVLVLTIAELARARCRHLLSEPSCVCQVPTAVSGRMAIALRSLPQLDCVAAQAFLSVKALLSIGAADSPDSP